MSANDFEKNIKAINFSFKTNKDGGGVILISEYKENIDTLSSQEIFALEIADKKFNADAVYFRYFNDERESVPQIYIFDNTNDFITEKDKDVIHKKMWSGCYVPLFIIIDRTEVRIFDSRQKANDNGKANAFENINLGKHTIEKIKLAGDAIEKFSAKNFDDGLFWEKEKYKNQFQFSTSAHWDLIDGLKKVYHHFQNDSGMDSHVALKLLVQCLLIKYLEERDEEKESGYFAKRYFKNNFNCDNFCDVIRTGQLLELLDKLAIDFNGKVFEWDKADEKVERQSIKKAAVKKLAEYLDGNSEGEQLVLWRLYSFSHLPVELISSVYEALLAEGKDVVYTPDVVASTLVDECMPLRNPKIDFKIIDVSCGSGIFLVKCYKRIIQWWRIENNLEKPNLNILRQLLTKNIFGRDIKTDAIRLSIFSLALALLDELDPKTIWEKMKFPDLGKENVKEEDFFHFITNQPPNNFDLVIGNPPFNPPEKINNGDYEKKLYKKYGYKSEIQIPYQNLALMFLVESMKLLSAKAMLCLIQPSGPLFYQKNTEFKNNFFSKYNLLQILDFTNLADSLWVNKSVPTAAVFIQNSKPDEKPVVHIIAKNSFTNEKKLFLDFDHYDFHWVNKEDVKNNPYLWKANALGGGRIVGLLNSLSKMRSLEEFLKSKKKEGWKNCDGFKIEGKKPKEADFITGKNFLPTQALTENGIDRSKIYQLDNIKKFGRRRIKELYTPPHLLFRKIIGKNRIVAEYDDTYLTFVSDIYSIHAPESSSAELKALAEYIYSNSDVLRFHILATSSRAKVYKATSISDTDILNLPYPEKISDIKLSKAEKIIVDEALEYLLSSKSEEALVHPAISTNLKAFAKTFCQTLNSVYKSNGKSFELFKTIETANYFALHFEYTKHNINQEYEFVESLEKYIQNVIPLKGKKEKPYHIQRILKVYSKDTIIIAKPKKLRYWLQSIALRDADESFTDYVKAGF